MNNSQSVEIISIDELCEILGCGYNTAYRLLGDHKIPSFKIGKCWKIPREGVEMYIREQSGLTTTLNPFTRMDS